METDTLPQLTSVGAWCQLAQCEGGHPVLVVIVMVGQYAAVGMLHS